MHKVLLGLPYRALCPPPFISMAVTLNLDNMNVFGLGHIQFVYVVIVAKTIYTFKFCKSTPTIGSFQNLVLIL